jgi:hypothetical protein
LDDAAPDLFFAFPDGALDYVCAECNALCCRGQGFGGSLRREAGALIRLYPALATAAYSRHGEVLSFRSAPPACYFLDGDNLCRIEKQHGRSLKPGVCTLFPFNVFTRIGATIAVSPHFLCPLRLASPPRPGSVEGTHARLEAAVRESSLLDPGYVETLPKAVSHPSQNAPALVKRERAFRDRCQAALGRGRFIETLTGDHAAPLREFLGRALPVVGLEPRSSQARDIIDDIFHAIAPPLRLGFTDLEPERVRRILALSEAIARAMLGLSPAPPTPQSVHALVAPLAPALRVLALDTAPLELTEKDLQLPPLGPEVTFAAFLAMREARKETLPALAKAFATDVAPADRWVLLNHFGSRLLQRGVGSGRKRRASTAAGRG